MVSFTIQYGERMAKKSRLSDRWIAAGVLIGVGAGMLGFAFTSNPIMVPAFTLLGLGLGFALSIIFRTKERE